MENNKKVIIFIVGGIIIIGSFLYSIINSKKNDYIKLEIENNVIQEEENKVKEKNIILHITGEVQNEGIITLKEGERVKDAIEAAGGATEEASLSDINLAYELSDGQKLYIPSKKDEEEKQYITEGTGQENTTEEKNNLVNINMANQTELETITGIGPSTALKIINYRKTNGKFTSIEEIKNISGIGEAKFETIKEQICIK